MYRSVCVCVKTNPWDGLTQVHNTSLVQIKILLRTPNLTPLTPLHLCTSGTKGAELKNRIKLI